MGKMKYNPEKTKLTTRQKNIIQLLTQFTTECPATISVLSEKLHCSSRTVLREMPVIESWLQEHKFSFFRKPGVGIVLNEDAQTKQKIFSMLEETEPIYVLSKEKRRKWILAELFYAKEPMKSYYFTTKYKISEGTLAHDLDFWQVWLQKYEVQIIRKSGVGIFLKGTESALRQAIANAIYAFMSEKEILDLLCGYKENTQKISVPSKYRDISLLDYDILQKVEQVLFEVEKVLQIQYIDSVYIGILIHISLAVKRLQNGEIIQIMPEKLYDLKQYPQYVIAKEIGSRIEKMFDLQLPEDEIGYIALHCIHANMGEENTEVSADYMQIQQCAKNMMQSMQKELETAYAIAFLYDAEMVADVSQQIFALLHRLKFHIPIQNAKLEAFSEQYENVCQATEKSCIHLKPVLKEMQISKEEICAMAMYFYTVLQKQQSRLQKIPVVVVCPTGFGTSKILAIHLQKEFPQLDIKEIVSVFRIDIEQLQRKNIQLVISTVQLDIDFLHIQVNPILLEKDKIALKEIISTLPLTSSTQKKKHTLLQKQDVLNITIWGQEVLAFLQNIKWYTKTSIAKKQELLEVASTLFTEVAEKQKMILSTLEKREKLASTYIPTFEMLLLHGKTNAVQHTCFGYIALEHSFFHKEGIIKGAIVMLIPEAHHQICMELVQHISGQFVENDSLFAAMQQKREQEFRKELEKSSIAFYQNMIKKRLEDVT